MCSRGKYTYGPEPNIKFAENGRYASFGKFCSLAPNLTIYLGGNHRIDWVTTYPFGHIHQSVFDTFCGKGHPATHGNVVVGNDVWIGENVTIMSGITIGDGAVVAGGSRVVKDVEAYTLVGGNPARYIRHRFTQEQIDALLKIKWWEWPDEKINQYASLLCNNDVDRFIKEANVSG